MKSLIDFEHYLLTQHYRPSTLQGHLQNVVYLLKWVGKNNYGQADNLKYTDLLNYVQYEQKRGMDTATINLRLSSICKYFDFLKQQEAVERNPARTLRIKGKTKTVIEQPLTYEELEKLYHSYKSLCKQVPLHIRQKSELAHQRNIIILGLLIWQGMHSGELQKLEVSHIDLPEGMIYIPSTARSNSRTLSLHRQQILSFHHYLHGGTRDNLNPRADELLGGNMHNIVNLLTQELKGINPQVKNALHIRGSVILHWLRQYNKRKVQYMAGHKYIGSTEKYEVQELQTLTDQLSRHHPFG